ncbi:MAG: SufD family Fe-S cluster assembly protein, partial [Spongiibacteraceae bacterium]|nr:SufD family Fe-S cluster assembly protein [Spongiibacteraceae bacterium]
MDFSLSEEQRLLRDNLRHFLSKHYPFEKRRASSLSESGWQQDIWQAFAKQLDILSMAFAGKDQHQDAGSKVIHLAPDTSSRVVSKSISAFGG